MMLLQIHRRWVLVCPCFPVTYLSLVPRCQRRPSHASRPVGLPPTFSIVVLLLVIFTVSTRLLPQYVFLHCGTCPWPRPQILLIQAHGMHSNSQSFGTSNLSQILFIKLLCLTEQSEMNSHIWKSGWPLGMLLCRFAFPRYGLFRTMKKFMVAISTTRYCLVWITSWVVALHHLIFLAKSFRLESGTLGWTRINCRHLPGNLVIVQCIGMLCMFYLIQMLYVQKGIIYWFILLRRNDLQKRTTSTMLRSSDHSIWSVFKLYVKLPA